MSDRPMPQIDNLSRPFWAGCNDGHLVLQHCQNAQCGRYIYYPRVCCPHCRGCTMRWEAMSGKGKIESYSRIHRPQHDSFQSEVPIYFIAVRLQEGPLMYSRLDVRPASDSGLVGHAVVAVFSDPIDSQRLPYFRLKT